MAEGGGGGAVLGGSDGEDERGGDSHLNRLRAAGENYVAPRVSPPTSHRFVIPPRASGTHSLHNIHCGVKIHTHAHSYFCAYVVMEEDCEVMIEDGGAAKDNSNFT